MSAGPPRSAGCLPLAVYAEGVEEETRVQLAEETSDPRPAVTIMPPSRPWTLHHRTWHRPVIFCDYLKQTLASFHRSIHTLSDEHHSFSSLADAL